MTPQIGNPPWDRSDLLRAIGEFERLYDERPIRDNVGGMKAPHMFATWFMARALRPELIVESGIWMGQSTWLLERACPDARLVSIDLDLSRRAYISPKATYVDRDFSTLDWTAIVPERTLAFFDDHQNAYTRLQQCLWFGFKHTIFEDNYPPSQGDCYSLKKALSESGFEPALLQSGLREKVASWLGVRPPAPAPGVRPNRQDAAMLRRNLEVYYEFPPVFKRARTRWGDPWTDGHYPTPPPLLEEGDAASHAAFYEEADHYTWIGYARLK